MSQRFKFNVTNSLGKSIEVSYRPSPGQGNPPGGPPGTPPGTTRRALPKDTSYPSHATGTLVLLIPSNTKFVLDVNDHNMLVVVLSTITIGRKTFVRVAITVRPPITEPDVEVTVRNPAPGEDEGNPFI
jgi:hypothetical protein